MNGVRVARKIHGVDPMPRKMSLQPVDTGQIGCKPVLNDDVFSHTRQLGGIKQGLHFGGDKIFGSC